MIYWRMHNSSFTKRMDVLEVIIYFKEIGTVMYYKGRYITNIKDWLEALEFGEVK